MSSSNEDSDTRSPGELLRRAGRLLLWLKKASDNLRNPSYTTMTGELERLRDESLYFLVDAGATQRTSQEVASLEFKGLPSRKPRSQRERRIVASGGVLPQNSSKTLLDQCKRNLGCLVERVEEVKCRLIGNRMANSSPSSSRAKIAPAPIRDLETLKKQVSLAQKQAAAELCVTPRTIRNLVKKKLLTQTAKRRIVVDEKFAKQFHSVHSPAQ